MQSKKIVTRRIGYVILILFACSFFYKLPYYVTKPGTAEELSAFVHVENGYKDSGSFMLTTVRMYKANIYTYAWGKWDDYHKVYKEADMLSEDETDEEYNVRQLKLMDQSQKSAILTAYKKAGKEVKYAYNGVYVLHVLQGMPADGHIKAGDRILKIDGQSITKKDFFIQYLSKKKAGDEVTIQFERDDKRDTAKIKLVELKEAEGRAGIGITMVEDIEVTTKPPVKIDAEKIGGPSAGLMFSLEIYNQLVKEDITKGYQIAGTGTISETGQVGPIGGIDQKIVAADKEGAAIFFAPNQNGAHDSDYKMAVRTAKDIGTKMKIVPVDTFDDAIAYLEQL